MQEFVPQSVQELIDLLQVRAESCYFRGQSNNQWVLNSTLARELRGETTYLPRDYIPKEPLETWTVQNLLNYHKIILSRWEPTEELLNYLAGKGDPYLDIIREVQQEKLKPKIHNAIPNHPTPTIEFSNNPSIALFFGSNGIFEKDKDGAVFCLDKGSILIESSFPFALSRMKLFGEIRPCAIISERTTNDLGNPKPKRQEAVYVFQRDLRKPIDHYLPIEKIVIKRVLKAEIEALLGTQGITDEYVYARDYGR